MARIDVRGLNKVYSGHAGTGPQPVIESLDLAIADHEFVCLLGPSGCGKSTFLNLVAGLDSDYDGIIEIGGRELHERAARVGYVFQEPRLLPWLTSEDNIRFALRNCRVPREEWEAIITEHLGLTGLNAYRRHYPHQLSGGMRQRLALARALAVSPEVLLMDEPFSGLDELTARRIRVDLLEIWRRKRKTVVFVTHNAYEAVFLADRVVVMAGGRVRREYSVSVPRPRDYDDPRLFEVNREVVKAFLEAAGEH